MNELNKVCVNIQQNFSEQQKSQARANIGVEALPDKTGNANKVLAVNNQATGLEWVAGGEGSQVQASWTESDTTSPAYIQNKPTLATVATSGSYYDLSNRPTLATVAQTGNYNDLVGRPSIQSMSLFHHSQQVSITAGQYVTPETFNLTAYIPANSKFYGSLTIERLSNLSTSGAYHFVLSVPNNSMTCNFGDYPAARQSGHNIGFSVDNSSGGSQYQLYFQLSGQFEDQNLTVHVDGIVFN